MSKKPLVYVLISAALFGISSPLAKLLVANIDPVALAGLLYLGAFIGLFFYSLISPKGENTSKAERLRKKDLPWLAGAVIAGGVIAPISQMMGLNLISGFSVSLLLNLEGVATALLAVLIFKENSGKRLWMALVCMTVAGVLLSWNPEQGTFNIWGPLLILLAVFCWGIDNNLTRQISDRNPIQIVYIKGLIGGTISLTLAFIIGARIQFDVSILLALLLGAFSYGISLVLFIKALKGLGSSRTGAFFSLSPFIGALVSVVLLREWAGWLMIPAFLLMVGGVWLLVNEKHTHAHTHPAGIHAHSHKHDDSHHLHAHTDAITKEHVHEHVHEEMNHIHSHWPDSEHRHAH